MSISSILSSGCGSLSAWNPGEEVALALVYRVSFQPLQQRTGVLGASNYIARLQALSAFTRIFFDPKKKNIG